MTESFHDTSTDNSHEPIDGLYTPGLVTAGFVAAIATFTLIVMLQVVYLYYKDSQRPNGSAITVNNSSASLIAEQKAKLRRYGWIDRENGIVAIPIDRAIELTARELSTTRRQDAALASPKPSRSSNAVEGSAASPAATTAGDSATE